MKVKDIIKRANTKEDRANTSLIYFAQGEHILPEDLTVYNKGIIAEADLGPMFYFGFKKGQLLLPSRSFESKKAAIALYDGICSEKTFVLETMDSNILLQEYLIFIFQSERFWKYCNENKSGSVNYFINWSAIADYEFDLPSLDEQKVLADKLWAAYRVKESYRKLLAATDDMIKAKFNKMVLDKVWSTEKLPNIATYCIGLTYKPADVCDDGVVVLRSGNIQNAQIDLSDIVRVSTKIRENLFVHENDILMCSRNGSAQLVGKTALIPKLDEPMTYGAFMTVIRSDYNRYLALYFQTDAFRKQLSGAKSSVMNQVTQKMLDEIIVPIPDSQTIDELTRIATQAEATKASLRQSIESIDRVIKSLINQ